MIKRFFEYLYKEAEDTNRENIDAALSQIKKGKVLLDVGCWDGTYTLRWGKSYNAKVLMGLEIVPEAVKLAKKRGIKVIDQDLSNNKWRVKDNSVDCVVSNLVIEHMSNVDNFISESFRVLKKGGYTIVSTNNLSSWHNIISILLGWTPFDMVNSSIKAWAIGNPLALHNNEALLIGPSYSHKCVYSIRWLKDWYKLYGFKFVDVKGAGYYPLPAKVGNIDKRHCAFMTLTFQKK